MSDSRSATAASARPRSRAWSPRCRPAPHRARPRGIALALGLAQPRLELSAHRRQPGPHVADEPFDLRRLVRVGLALGRDPGAHLTLDRRDLGPERLRSRASSTRSAASASKRRRISSSSRVCSSTAWRRAASTVRSASCTAAARASSEARAAPSSARSRRFRRGLACACGRARPVPPARRGRGLRHALDCSASESRMRSSAATVLSLLQRRPRVAALRGLRLRAGPHLRQRVAQPGDLRLTPRWTSVRRASSPSRRSTVA
ncbi:MAG: hypothetical protein R2736_17865 [Solirubrobacterales bacterium]